MQTFISETLNDVLKNTSSLENAVIILPSQRAKVFVKQDLKDKISIGFLPEILSIEEFIQQVSEIYQIDNIQLLFEFYAIYKKLEKDQISFDAFTSWASTVLQDFNDIDQHLINTDDIFAYIRDIERLRKWSVKGTFKETDLIKDHHSFLEKLNSYYKELYTFLKRKNIGYQGLIYREACNKIDSYLTKNSHKTFSFIGFNALNKAEEFIFQKVLENGASEIYWDVDETFFNTNHSAGKFIRQYKSEWKYYENKELKTLTSNFNSSKNIQIIGAAKNITQVKYIGEILEKKEKFNNTALVLADETLLPVALSSLPKNINAINITMGYPLKDIPVVNLFTSIFKLFLTQEKLNKSITQQFYFKDVIQFFRQPFIYQKVPNIDEFCNAIAQNNITFITKAEISNLLEKSEFDYKNSILNIFNPFTSIQQFIAVMLDLIDIIKEETVSLEKEYLFRFYTILNQLNTLQKEYHHFSDLKTFFQFFKQITAQESLSFQGEPLKGLQLMGMLETRVLDFETIIIASANEGVLPANFQKNSFIPFDVKIQYGLPTYREKDAIFSYHFFRLTQRAKNIYILYNTDNDGFGNGEKSRFVTQLEMLQPNITKKMISPLVVAQKNEQKEIFKNEQILVRLREIAKQGFSPSSLTNYLRNPITFYKQKILKIKEFNDVEETVAANTLGTIVHETLDKLYTPLVGKLLSVEIIKDMMQKSTDIVQHQFKVFFKNGDISTGKNRLIFEVANRFVYNFLNQELKLVSNKKNQLKIIATEEDLASVIQVDGLDFPIKIHGKVDRVDELNGVTRIIDYKTGLVKNTELKISDFSNLRDDKHHKAIQVLLYAFLFTKSKNYNKNKKLTAGIFSFKNLNSKFLSVDFAAFRKPSETNITQDKLEEFLSELKTYIVEIYNKEISFLEPIDAKY